jgi:hypothetical protein
MTGSPGDASRTEAAVGAELRAAAVFGTTASTFDRITIASGMIDASTSADRSVGVVFTTAAATNAAIDRTLNVQLMYGALRAG